MKDTVTLMSYIPHGLNENLWHKFTTSEELALVDNMKKQMFGDEWSNIKFVVLYNGRNIQRKRTTDVIMAYREFLLGLPKEQRESCRLLLKTDPIDPNGVDLPRTLKALAPDIKVVFAPDRVPEEIMVQLCNVSDVIINLSEAEGFGLPIAECLLTERMIIVNITGGLQDTVGSQTKDGEYLHPDKHYNKDFQTNADGIYPYFGEWCVGIIPKVRNYIGSLETPYIMRDQCTISDAANALRQVYDMPKEERERRGKSGREYALKQETGMTSTMMCDRLIANIDEVFDTFTPRERFGLYKI